MVENISVYIPAYNAAAFLPTTLEALFKQSLPAQEILVINDGSSDKTVELAKKYGARVVNHAKNQGIAVARNTGVQAAKNSLVASLDADCEADPNWLKNLYQTLQNYKVAGVGGRLLEKYDQSPAVQPLPMVRPPLPDYWRQIHMKQHWGMDFLYDPPMLFGANTLFFKEILEKVNYYDEVEQYRTNNEDYRISKKLYAAGYHLAYEPAAVVFHHRKDTLYSLFSTYWRWFFLHQVRPVNLKRLIAKTYYNLIAASQFGYEDFKAKRIRLLALDWLYFIYQSWFDFEYYLKVKRGRALIVPVEDEPEP